MSSRAEVLQILIESIRASQGASGRSGANVIPEVALPDIDGFDSLVALEVLVAVSERTGIEIPDDVLMPSPGAPPLTVSLLADSIYSLLEGRNVKP